MGYLYDSLTKLIKDVVDSINSKVGTSLDVWSADKTILGYTNVAYQHIHKSAKCYPTLANGVTIDCGAESWGLGGFAEIVPANAINTTFDIHWINVEAASANDVYEIVLYSGLAENEVEIGRVRSQKNSTPSGANNIPIQIPPRSANTRIVAKAASSSGSADTVTISLFYHEYE